MDPAETAISYAMLLIPSFFAFTVLVQGFLKVSRSEPDGGGILGLGGILIILIIGAYFFYIR